MLSLDTLLAWAAQGWHLFPLSTGSKVPERGTNGCSDGTTDRDTIRMWWENKPDRNWGLACGLSDILVVE